MAVMGEGPAIEKKGVLKARGYAWSPGEFGRPKCWYSEVSDADKAAEVIWLRENVMGPDQAVWALRIAAIVWLAASALFSWYVASFGSYNKTYGSLGAVIGFMTWIWISIIVVLVGAKLNAEMEHQTVHESTTGQPKPIGRRGARMADTVVREGSASS